MPACAIEDTPDANTEMLPTVPSIDAFISPASAERPLALIVSDAMDPVAFVR